MKEVTNAASCEGRDGGVNEVIPAIQCGGMSAAKESAFLGLERRL